MNQPKPDASRPLVLWLAAEAIPWAHTGGLGDVIGSLPAVLRAKGWDVRLCLPLYADARQLVEQLDASPRIGSPILTMDVAVGSGRRRVGAAIREAIDPPAGVPTYLVECPLFERRGIYGTDGEAYPDNPFRYGVWQLAARQLAATLAPGPALIHCHDWHAALTPALVKFPGQWPAERADVRTVFTIHNLQYQGNAGRDVLDELGLPRAMWHPQWLEHFGGVNFVKGAILSADRVTTVSRTYADEIRTSAHGMGLDGPLRDRAGDLAGIVNGIDTVAFDPATDRSLPARYDADHPEGRATCQHALRAELGFASPSTRPLLGFIGRLAESKGADLLISAAPALLALGIDIVVLGSGERRFAEALLALEAQHPGRFRAFVRFDAALARRIYGGVDMMLVPSRIEPCGLVQLYALRYGAVPIVHAVGGLRDTVADGVTGFAFTRPSTPDIVAAVGRALEAHADARRWSALRAAGMHQDWSWSTSASGYDALYKDVLARPPRRRSLPPPEDDQALFADEGTPLPARLPWRALHLLAQGPRRLYAYWELDAQPENEPLALMLEEQPTGRAFVLARDLPAAGELWMPAQPEHAYRVTLRRGSDGADVLRSNVIVTARDTPAPPGEEAPAWLERLLRAGALDDVRGAERWAAVFPQPPTVFEGAPPWPDAPAVARGHVGASPSWPEIGGRAEARR
ncbi:MAG TPA: glycogen/starch synthase [Polyangia bacterium]|nr:glycogen/starch synthase [Polyangia bacterium]